MILCTVTLWTETKTQSSVYAEALVFLDSSACFGLLLYLATVAVLTARFVLESYNELLV